MAIQKEIKLEEQINTVSQIVEDDRYRVLRTKDPRKKRAFEASINFWNSILNSLNDLKQLKESVKSLS